MIRDQTSLIFSPLFTAVHALTWAKVTAQLKLNILRKLDRTRCSEPDKIQALAFVKQADQHLIRPRGNLRMSRYWLPHPPTQKKSLVSKVGKIHIIICGGGGRRSFLWQAPVRCGGWINTGRFANSQSAKTSDRHSRRPG